MREHSFPERTDRHPVVAGGERLSQLAAEAAAAPTPAAALRKVRELRRELEEFERARVAEALGQGVSFAAIARELGRSRQAVHRRFRDLTDAAPRLRTAPELRRVLRDARDAAASLRSHEVRSEHVLLAVLRETDLPAAAVLRAAGATLERVRAQLDAAAPRVGLVRRAEYDAGDMHALLSGPAHEARRRGGPRIEVEHLLLGALEDPASGASRVLRALDVDVDPIRRRLAGRLESAQRRGEPNAAH